MIELLKEINVYILIGGQSRRMKTTKSLVQLNGKSLTENVYENLNKVFKDVYIVGKENHFPQYNFVRDLEPVQCPLNGIVTSIEHSQNDWIFVIACDLPFIKSNTINYLFDQYKFDEQIVIPKIGDRLQPLCAFYNKSVLNHFKKAIALGNYSLILSFDKLLLNEVNVEKKYEDQFMNMNSPKDLEKASKLLNL